MRPVGHQIHGRKTSFGFTIVELLIVIIVIGILATIVIVAYNGVTKSAQQSAIYSEMKQWQKLFIAYKALNGAYPSPAPGGNPLTDGGPGASAVTNYCLGTGFPNGSCLVDAVGTAFSVDESRGAALISQLSTVGRLPTNSTKYVYDTNVVGPYLQYGSMTTMFIWGVFPGGTTCPSDTTTNYTNANRVHCYITLS
jgi:prepilin-type N-terminal cleavage/methylation domain-containing protein